jgi:hypothetical protein
MFLRIEAFKPRVGISLLRVRSRQQTAAHRDGREFVAAACAELAEQYCEMKAHVVDRDGAVVGDLGVRAAGSNQPQDLRLSWPHLCLCHSDQPLLQLIDTKF